jgi:hypothetical protein
MDPVASAAQKALQEELVPSWVKSRGLQTLKSTAYKAVLA